VREEKSRKIRKGVREGEREGREGAGEGEREGRVGERERRRKAEKESSLKWQHGKENKIIQ
jgi:hypothetical protein